MKKFITEMGIVPEIENSVPLYCDNTGAVAQAKEPRSQHKSKHILRRFHLVREIIERQDVIIERVDTKNNIADPFTKALPQQLFDRHLDCMELKYKGDWLQCKWEIERNMPYKPIKMYKQMDIFCLPTTHVLMF